MSVAGQISPCAAATDAAELPTRPLAFLLRYVRLRRWQFALLFALVCGAAACAVGVQYGMKLIVDTMSSGRRGDLAIWRWLTLFVTLIAVESVLWRTAGWMGCRTVVATGVDMRLDLFRHLTGHSVRYFTEHLSGSLGNRITATAGASGSIFATLTWHVVPPCMDFVLAVIVITTIDPRMAFALLGSVVVVALAITRYGVRGRPLHQAYGEQASKVGGEVVDVVANMWTVKAFSAREREYRRLQTAFGLEADAQRRSWLYLERVRVLHDVCLWLTASTMLVWALHGWRRGNSTPGDVVVISALTFRILHGSRDLALALVDASQQFGVIGEMLRVIAPRHQVVDAAGAARFAPGAGAVRFDRVSFNYADRKPLFEGLSLTIPAGQRVGLIGPSGAGKSTLIALMQRLDDPFVGTVSIDGQCLTRLTQDSLRAAIAVVPQDIALFHRSVMENIRYGRPDASDDEVRAAARHAHCDDFIHALPQGYDSLVGERGARLSGGQRQRIGIARAFLKDASILLLDEATSALDSRSEAEVQQALATLMRGRTVIAVAHRLATVMGFDRAIVMVDGRIVEDGPPAALRRGGGSFEAMWRLQAEGFALT